MWRELRSRVWRLKNILMDLPGGGSLLEGQKDGMERFWYSNGRLKEEGQWFNNRPNGLMRAWDEEGKLTKAVRYKNGDLIEVLRQ